MFSSLQTEIADRLLSASAFFDSICPPGTPATAVPSIAIQVAKGLSFVHLYSVYEYAVNEVFRAGLVEVKKHGLQIAKTRLELLALGLDPEICAVVQCGPKRVWDVRMNMLSRSGAADTFHADESMFPADGTHYRLGQLETIWRLFGISGPILPHPKFGTLIDELVENRNAVAHGRRTAVDVGSGYSPDEIRKKTADTRDFCLHLTAAMQAHCGAAANFSR